MVQHRGRRSEFNQQRRFVNHIVANTARHDKIGAEHICMLTKAEALDAVKENFNTVAVGTVCFERGEIVIDSCGKSSLQLPENYRHWELAVARAILKVRINGNIES